MAVLRLLMRQGVDTVKPDVHVKRFAEAAVGRKVSDQDGIEPTTQAAARIEIKAFELEWRMFKRQVLRTRRPTGLDPATLTRAFRAVKRQAIFRSPDVQQVASMRASNVTWCACQRAGAR